METEATDKHLCLSWLQRILFQGFFSSSYCLKIYLEHVFVAYKHSICSQASSSSPYCHIFPLKYFQAVGQNLLKLTEGFPGASCPLGFHRAADTQRLTLHNEFGSSLVITRDMKIHGFNYCLPHFPTIHSAL